MQLSLTNMLVLKCFLWQWEFFSLRQVFGFRLVGDADSRKKRAAEPSFLLPGSHPVYNLDGS